MQIFWKFQIEVWLKSFEEQNAAFETDKIEISSRRFVWTFWIFRMRVTIHQPRGNSIWRHMSLCCNHSWTYVPPLSSSFFHPSESCWLAKKPTHYLVSIGSSAAPSGGVVWLTQRGRKCAHCVGSYARLAVFLFLVSCSNSRVSISVELKSAGLAETFPGNFNLSWN